MNIAPNSYVGLLLLWRFIYLWKSVLKEELVYEQKMDEITVQLEELILDAMIAALQKIGKRNLEFIEASIRSQTDQMNF